MSWMDSWSRPSKSQSTPAPFYALPNGASTPYCRTCGRVISSRKNTSSKTVENKYCSARCRGQKPGKLDRAIEGAFVRYLTGEEHVGEVRRKGERRVLVPCEVVEVRVFGERRGPEKVFGRRRNRASRVIAGGSDEGGDVERVESAEDPGEEVIDEMVRRTRSLEVGHEEELDPSVEASRAVRSGTRVRLPQTKSQVNGSVGGEKGLAERVEETDEMRERRAEGQKKARERELVRCAARRGVVFGFEVEGGERRKCEAVMQGKVVEPSFAKGEWAVRWREE